MNTPLFRIPDVRKSKNGFREKPHPALNLRVNLRVNFIFMNFRKKPLTLNIRNFPLEAETQRNKTLNAQNKPSSHYYYWRIYLSGIPSMHFKSCYASFRKSRLFPILYKKLLNISATISSINRARLTALPTFRTLAAASRLRETKWNN
jgi:ssDNA-specific exonuclease RecJ